MDFWNESEFRSLFDANDVDRMVENCFTPLARYYVARAPIHQNDREDVVQSCIIKCWKFRKYFDPAKGSGFNLFSKACSNMIATFLKNNKRHLKLDEAILADANERWNRRGAGSGPCSRIPAL